MMVELVGDEYFSGDKISDSGKLAPEAEAPPDPSRNYTLSPRVQ
jgi:hypothetical protein